MRLYEYGEQFEKLYELANNEEDTESLTALFDELGAGLTDKLENTAKVVKDFESESEMLDSEIKRLSERKKQAQNGADRLKKLMLFAVEKSGQSKIKGQLFSFGLRISESIEIVDETLIPDDLCRFKKEPDKKAIKELITSGQSVYGATLIVKNNLTIR